MKIRKKYFTLILLLIVLMTSTLSAYGAQSIYDHQKVARILAVEKVVTTTTKEELKKAIQENINGFNQSFSIAFTGEFGETKKIVGDIFEELWNGGDYEGGVVAKYQFNWSGYNGNITIQFSVDYVHTNEQETKLNEMVTNILSQIITTDMTDLEKVKAVHDYVVQNSKYSYTNPAGVSIQSPLSLLQGNQGVCQAYALLTYKMLYKLGINVKYVLGYAKEYHAWNLVQLGNNWYHLDTTWSDPVPDFGRVGNYSYFLMSDKQISKDHTWTRENYPTATDDQYGYFHKAYFARSVEDAIYYIDFKDESDYRLYKMKLDGTMNTTITSNNVDSFAILGNKLYYSNYSNGGFLYSANLDGSSPIMLKEEHVTKVQEENGAIYYIRENSGIMDRIVIDKVAASYEQPSGWAKAGVDKAIAYGIVDDYLLSNYTKNITRGEFCDLVMNIYEVLSEKSATVPSKPVFQDTSYKEILKAYQLKIVNGTSATKFDPKADITREQIAVMYRNLLTALEINPMLTDNYVFFKDEAEISSWAKDAVQTMNKLGILTGVGDSKISPKIGATREQAINLAVRLYEKYK